MLTFSFTVFAEPRNFSGPLTDEIPSAVIQGADIQNLAVRGADPAILDLDEHTLNAILRAAFISDVDLSISTVYLYKDGVIAFLTPLDPMTSFYDDLVDETWNQISMIFQKLRYFQSLLRN